MFINIVFSMFSFSLVFDNINTVECIKFKVSYKIIYFGSCIMQ